MATLPELVTALKDTINTYYLANDAGLQVYEYVPGQVAAPCVVIEPSEGEYHQTMGAAPSQHTLAAIAIVPQGERFSGQMELMQMISATGARSIKAAVASDPYLGGVAKYADASKYRDFGTRRWSEVDYLMCTVEVEVLG